MDTFYMLLSWVCGLLTGTFLTLAYANIKRRMEKEESLKTKEDK
jgi:hypothetical protein